MKTAKKHEPQFSDRIRFNWGFHDARNDVERGFARTPIDGPAPKSVIDSMRVVSKFYDAAYHAGYVEGLAEARECGMPHTTSDRAWEKFTRAQGVAK